MKVPIALVALLLLFVVGCAVPHGQIRPRDSAMLRPGMSKVAVIAVLGQPDFGYAVGREERLSYQLGRPSEGVRPFEITLVDGVVRTYGVIERDPGRVDHTVGNFQQEMAVPWYSRTITRRSWSSCPPTKPSSPSPMTNG